MAHLNDSLFKAVKVSQGGGDGEGGCSTERLLNDRMSICNSQSGCISVCMLVSGLYAVRYGSVEYVRGGTATYP